MNGEIKVLVHTGTWEFVVFLEGKQLVGLQD